MASHRLLTPKTLSLILKQSSNGLQLENSFTRFLTSIGSSRSARRYQSCLSSRLITIGTKWIQPRHNNKRQYHEVVSSSHDLTSESFPPTLDHLTTTFVSEHPASNSLVPPVSLTQQFFTSVVKVFCDHTDPNFALPWQMRRQASSTGSGFAVEGRRLMTNAHCIAYQNRVLVRKHGDARRYPAKVIAVAHECDLALLTVDDDEFWKNMEPLTFGDLPNLHDSVVVVGYPTRGDNLSITAGIVSRLDVTTYAHSNFKLLCAQIDAAINPGNSGGPAFSLPDGKVAGVAFQGYGDAQNIGYIVPTNVIQHFLADVEKHQQYTGFVIMGIAFQTLENSALRQYFGLDTLDENQLPSGIHPSGILVTQVDTVRNEQFKQDWLRKKREKTNIAMTTTLENSSTPSSLDKEQRNHTETSNLSFSDPSTNMSKEVFDDIYGLQKNDILLAVNGVDVANNGTVHFRGMERVHLSHVTLNFFSGDSINALVLRKKQLLTIQVPLYAPNYLVPGHQWDQSPKYFIFGGPVFCPLTTNYLRDEFGKRYYEKAPSWLTCWFSQFFPTRLDQEIVILSQILASDLTIGYELKNYRLHKVDGIPVDNLGHLVSILASHQDKPFVQFEFDHEMLIILDRHAAQQKTPLILKEHTIARPWSEDLNDVASKAFGHMTDS